MSPELLVRLADDGQLKQVLRVSLLAVDEAHCVSEWGFHFRPEYGQLRRVIASISAAGYGGRAPPVICVTATCTADVREDVLRSLGLDVGQTDLVVCTMNRPNLHYAVEECVDGTRMQRRLLELFDVSKLNSSAVESRRALPVERTCPDFHSLSIVYVHRKADCDKLARLLQAGGVRAAQFHSGLSPAEREHVQHAFQHDELQVVIATVAFGMGIDKPDVRRVLHFGLPSSLEAYSQESGRAGRDGRPAQCLILFMHADRVRREMAIRGDGADPRSRAMQRTLQRLQTAFEFCRSKQRCRRARLLEYFGENSCDPSLMLSSQAPPAPGTVGCCVAKSKGTVHCGHCDICCTDDKEPMARLRLNFGLDSKTVHKEITDLRQRCVASPSRARLLVTHSSKGGQPPCVESCSVNALNRELIASCGKGGPLTVNLTCGKDSEFGGSGHGEHSWFSTVLQRQNGLRDQQSRQRELASVQAETSVPQVRSLPGKTAAPEMHQASGAALQMTQQRLSTKPVPASLKVPMVKSDGCRYLPGSSDCLSTAGGLCMRANCNKTVQRPAVKSSLGRSRSRRNRSYGDAERMAATPFIAKLMEAADFNSNVTGGSVTFKRLIREAQSLGPPEAATRLGEVLRVFKSNTPGKHGTLLDEIIIELEKGLTHEAVE